MRRWLRSVRQAAEWFWTNRRWRPTQPQIQEQLAATGYQPIRRIRIGDQVARLLFDEFAQHRRSARGREEFGWALLGLRHSDEAVIMATLPAGAQRDAGTAHILFNASAQALASRIVRQQDRKLTLLGVVHTHPGSLRHPSEGDYRGDIQWVRQLRGGQGIFGIGTADVRPHERPSDGEQVAWQPESHVHCLGELRFSWYTLAAGQKAYRKVPIDLTLGPDLAGDLRSVWDVIENHAERLNRLAGQLAKVSFRAESPGTLGVLIPRSVPGESLRILIDEFGPTYFLIRDGKVLAANLDEPHVDVGVYKILAALAE